MAEENEKLNHPEQYPDIRENSSDENEGLDAGSKALANALRISFNLLKVVMVVLVLAFLGSGFFTVEAWERAMVLRLGKITGQGQDRVLEPGWHWAFPAPIDEIVKIPVGLTQTLKIDSFWYYQTEREKLTGAQGRVPNALDPEIEGYTLTRNESIEGFSGSDYNIVHSQWQLVYRISDAELFFKNVQMPSLSPGQDFFDVAGETVDPLLESLTSDAIVRTFTRYSIEESLAGKSEISSDVRRKLQQSLNEIDSGITVTDVQMTRVTWPRQVDEAFLASTQASQQSSAEVSDARGYAQNILNEVAGAEVARELAEELRKSNPDSEKLDQLWAEVAGTAGQILAEARAYRTEVAEKAKARADYFEQLLPEYQQRPYLVLKRIYQDTTEEVLSNAEEKILLQSEAGHKGREIRMIISRDPLKDNNKSQEDNN